jgi:hypothetical protein
MTLTKRKIQPLNVLRTPFPAMVVHAVIYIRVSTEEQALQGYSLEAQVEEVKAKCRQESRKFPATMTYIGASDVTP